MSNIQNTLIYFSLFFFFFFFFLFIFLFFFFHFLFIFPSPLLFFSPPLSLSNRPLPPGLILAGRGAAEQEAGRGGGTRGGGGARWSEQDAGGGVEQEAGGGAELEAGGAEQETEARGEEQEAGCGGGGGRRCREAAVGARAPGRRAGLGTRMEKQRAGEEEAGGSHIFWLALPCVSHRTASLQLLGASRFAECRLARLHQKPLEKPLDEPCQRGS